jgi:serine/threonine-protein kinase
VLPFVNTSGDPRDDYFSDGLTDELAHALAHVPGLRLAGRTSSYAFKGQAVAAPEIGRALGVAALVVGTVRRSGDRLRVTAQLVSAADGTVRWDSVYESRSQDVFAVQDSLTRTVVAALAPALGVRAVRADRAATPVVLAAGRGTGDAEAYDLYLKGRYYWHERGAANVARAIAYFQQAIARDPTFARAYAGLAMAYQVLPVYVPDPSDSATALVEASARRAMLLDSTLADAQIAIALASEERLHLADAQAHYRAALAIEPSNEMAHHALGMLLTSTGRTDEGIAEIRRATRLDPLAKSAGTAETVALVFARRFAEAEAASRRVLALDSTFPLGILTLGFAQAFGGQPDSAIRTLARGVRLNPTGKLQQPLLLYAYAVTGRWADAERVRARLHAPGGDRSGGVEAALADLVFGDREPLVRLLASDRGQHRWYDGAVGFGCNPLLDPLWSDARFRAAMRRLAIAPCPLARPWPLPPRPGA